MPRPVPASPRAAAVAIRLHMLKTGAGHHAPATVPQSPKVAGENLWSIVLSEDFSGLSLTEKVLNVFSDTYEIFLTPIPGTICQSLAVDRTPAEQDNPPPIVLTALIHAEHMPLFR